MVLASSGGDSGAEVADEPVHAESPGSAQEPGMDRNRGLDPAVKRKLLELLEILARRGDLRLEEVAGAIGGPSDLPMIRDLEAEILWRRAMMDVLAEDHEDLEARLGYERAIVMRGQTRIRGLERRLEDAQRIVTKLVDASRSSLVTLKKVRGEHPEESFANEIISPIVRDIGDVARVAQELRAIALIKASAGAREPPGS